MNWFRRVAVIVAAGAISTASFAQQQPGLPLPRLDAISPMGAKAGTSVAEVTLVGADLDDATELLFAHPNIKSEVVKPEEPKVDPKDPKKQPAMPKKSGPAAIKFKVTVGADVPPGQYDVRVINKFGVSGPRVFVVGELAEVAEKEPNNDVPEAMKLDLNTTVNGAIGAATDVDIYSVTAKKGQRIVVACVAESIDSKARPLVEVYEVSGRRLVSQNGADAVTDFIAPADGDYLIRVAEFTYTAGGPLNFYRLTVTTGPWVDAAYPPMVEPGKTTAVTLYGRNLPGGAPEQGATVDGRPVEKLVVQVAAPAQGDALLYRGRVEPRTGGADGFEYRLKGPNGTSNPVFLAFAQSSVVLEKEPNDKADSAMELPGMVEVAGRIDKRNDRDWYTVPVKKGETVVVDLWADRIGVPTDFLLSIRAPKSTTDQEKDDNPESLSNTHFFSRTTDPDPLTYTAAEDGKLLIQVNSRESSYQFGPKVGYRLRVSAPRPDFRLVAMPASRHAPDVTILRADGHNYLDVLAFRYDGFNGPIMLTVEGLPAGVTCVPQTLSPGTKSAGLVLSANASAATFSGKIVVKGTATINGKSVVHEARPATISWGVQPMQNIPTITRLDSSLMLAVREKAMFTVTAEPDKAFVKMGEKLPMPLVVKQGDKLTVPLKVNRISPDAKVPVTVQQVFTGQNAQQLPITVNNGQPVAAIAPDKAEGTAVLDIKPTAAPGAHTIVLKATAQVQYEREGTKGKKPATVEQAVTPISVYVLPSSVAKLTATPAGNLKAGMTTEVTVKAERQFDYTGELKLKVVLPMNTKGITVADVSIPAGQTEAKLAFVVAADAAAGNLQNITVQATAQFDGKYPIIQEVKFNATVEKAPAPPKKK